MRAWDVDALLRLYDPHVEYLPLTETRVESGGYRVHGLEPRGEQAG